MREGKGSDGKRGESEWREDESGERGEKRRESRRRKGVQAE